ncbi:EAL domain-containing protein [Methylophaga sp. OBS4]|uniref:bifunctional diguanylate cyclase/phosphodiesterase n=1 Tax=Methylophaga sp. OBS4 TaxID=2991935 RepID=UPI0022592317|nr:EAL domain-containing protein [Methylophaga sp. OBS4]MCX4187041.1 EAL domain-containing protein [Methylophaga sp. OBS4]
MTIYKAKDGNRAANITSTFNWKTLLVWWTTYAVTLTVGHLIVDQAYGLTSYLFNGGFLLVALLDLNRRQPRLLQHGLFLLGVFALDWITKVTFSEVQSLVAAIASCTLILQAWLGFVLLQRFAAAACLPDTLRKALAFLLYAVLVPVLLSSFAQSLLVELWTNIPLSIEAVSEEFIWWFLRRFTSLVLVAPLLLFWLNDCRRLNWRKASQLSLRFVWGLLMALAIAAVIFMVANPAGRSLATYSYLLVPVMVFIAIHLRLSQSLLVMLLVSIVSFWADSVTAGNIGQAQHSMMALSVFMIINTLVVWLLGVLVRERDLSLAQEHKQRNMYEMLSRVNQLLVNNQLDEQQSFGKICQLIIDESDFQQVCVTRTDDSTLPESFATLCVNQAHDPLPSEQKIDARCELVQQVIQHNSSVYFAHCGLCPKYIQCRLKPISNGSTAAFPIKKGAQLVAILSVFSKQSEAFDPDIRRLFQEMADDLGFAIAMFESRAQLKQVAEVFQYSRESIIIANSQGTILNVNPAFTRITGYTRKEAIGNNPRMLQSGRQDRDFYRNLFHELQTKGSWSGEFWNKRKDGELYLQRGTISAVLDEHGDILHLIAIMEDVTEHLQAEEKIQHLANYDQLTGLPNRALLKDRFQQAVGRSRREGLSWALLFIDLDEFKQVNDALGHHCGDELLKQVGHRLRKHVRETDTFSRFGGDEFIILMQGQGTDASLLAERLIEDASRSYQLPGETLQIGASIGIATYPQDGETLEALIQAADTAMYQAKADGRGRYAFFAQAMQDSVQYRLTLRRDLERAIRDNELCLYYQPKVTYSNGLATRVGYEALVRWNKPGEGMVSPAEFIAATEASGQIADIDRWVIQNVIAQIATWQGQSSDNLLPVAINVSASLFSKPQFVDELEWCMSSFGVPSHLVELEITEHVTMLDMKYTLRTLKALKALGVGLAIDDFGTGYSSLAYLRQFPIDTLKIDLSFVRDVHVEEKNQGIVKAIITMAHSLGMKTIAEGVESVEELTFLMDHHCDNYQGFYFGRPEPEERLE